ncbi:MAG: CotH kinase family protein [Saprospiraceae bacterium]
MKNLLFFLILTLIFSCTKFNEDFQLLNISEIATELPVINIEVDCDEFNKMNEEYEEEIEIEGRFNMFRNGILVVENEEVELEIKGGFSTKFSLKTLGVKFEDKYDNSDRSLINPNKILPHHNLDEIKAIRLRNSGNDFVKTMMKDLSLTQLAINADLNLDLTYGEPVLVYINNDFHGLLNLRTEANSHGVAGLYSAKKSAVTLAKITTHELIKKDGDFDRIDAFVKAIEEGNLNYLKEELDVDNFIDYMVFQSYIANVDWPHNNARFYAIDQGKFRFVLFDLDGALRLRVNKEPLNIIEDKRFPNILTDLFFIFYKEENFQQAFWNRYNSLLASGVISYDSFKPIMDVNIAQIDSEIQIQIGKHQAPRTMIEWNIELDKLLTLFQEREKVVIDFAE